MSTINFQSNAHIEHLDAQTTQERTGSLGGKKVTHHFNLAGKLKAAAKIAPLALATIAIANTLVADGGAVLYNLCIAACTPLLAPPI